jgi:hypothetical protein
VLAAFPDIIKKIGEVPFNGIGSFWPGSSSVDQPELCGYYDREDAPFATFAEYVVPQIHEILTGLREGTRMTMWHRADLFYLQYLELLDLINNDPDMSNPEPMYLDHGDGWQFMFDSGRTHVKCILDWER